MQPDYFRGKKIWITGASSGIGRALTLLLSASGASIILSSRNSDTLKEVASACDNPDSTYINPLDTSSIKDIDQVCSMVLKDHFVDILILNAGISQRAFALDTEFETEERIMNTNFRGVSRMAKHVLRQMVSRNSGHIVIMSSVTGKIGVPGRSSYAASKHALHGYFDSVRAEVFKHNIKVTIICPGYIHTSISQNALLGDGSAHVKKDENSANGMKVEVFTRKALKAIAKQREEVYIGSKEILGIYIKRFYPKLLRTIMQKRTL